MTSPIFLYLTLGAPGARGDFVAGWLSSLPWVINNEWTIDPLTGRSYGGQQLIRKLDHVSIGNTTDLNDALLTCNWHLDSTAKLAYSGALHGFKINSQVTTDNLSAIKFIVIDTSDIDPLTLHWEFCVKTWGSYDHRRHVSENNSPNYHIDHKLKNQPITDQDRCEMFKTLLLNTPNRNYMPTINFPHVTIKYNDIISPTGSKKLAELLNMVVDPAYHKLWETNLTLADTPDLVNLFGQCWSKTMCI